LLSNSFIQRGAVLAALLVLAACGAQGVRSDAQQLLAAGDFEKAIGAYRQGLQRYPENVELRSGLLRAEESALGQLLGQLREARLAGDLDRATQLGQRGLAIRADDARLKSLLLDVERDRRLHTAWLQARDLIGKGFVERAAALVESGLKDDPAYAPLLALQRQLELDGKQAETEMQKLSESRPISLDFRDANLRLVLEVITRNSGVNFVLDKDIRQDLRTTVLVKKTQLDEALDLLTSTNQLAYKVIDPTTILIYPRTPEKIREYQDLVIRAFYLSNADVRQTALLLKSMLKIRDPFVDEKLNMIMIRETPQAIRLAERVIALHDLAEPEVMMEVEVLEVKRSSLTELGIKYPDGVTLTPLAPTGGFTLDNVSGINSKTIGVNVPALPINLHRDVGDVNILANPKIRARNREKAKVLIGDKLPVVTTTGSAANGGFISESVQYVDVGLKLDVEPNIYLDDDVAIKVGLEVSSLVREIKTSSGSLVYQIGTRTASTVLRLRDGETQLLAGLISNEERMSANRVPGLGDLPVVGRLFASQRDDNQRTEIVLSVTPRIIRNVRRPDLHQTEFWSGTENDVRSKPLVAGGRKAVPAAAAESAGAAPLAETAGTPGQALALKLQGPASVRAGEVFDVTVQADSAAALRGMALQLRFPAQLLQIQDVIEGKFFKQDGGVTSKTKALEQSAGLVSTAVLRQGAEGINGQGAVATFRFQALQAGEAQIRLGSAKPIGNTAAPSLPAALQVTVQ
jgi:general secretion pathway protein D